MRDFKLVIILGLSFIAITILFENNKSDVVQTSPSIEIKKTIDDTKTQNTNSIALITQQEEFFNVATFVDTNKLNLDEPKKGNIAIIPQDNDIEFEEQKEQPLIKKLTQDEVDKMMKKYVALIENDDIVEQKKAEVILENLKARYVLDELAGIVNDNY